LIVRISWCRLVLVALVGGITAALPARGQDLVRKALEDSTFVWSSSESDGIRIYYQKGSFAEQHRSMLLRSARVAVDEVQASLGESELERPFHLFYLESREEMERIVGQPVTGLANWGANAVFVVVNPDWRSFEKHEIAHVFTMGRWGPPHDSSRWMIEGIAIYSDGWCREYTNDEIAFRFLSDGQLPPLQELFDNYRTLGEIRGGFYAASVIGFIRDTYGVDALRKVWRDGSENLTELLGASADEVETSWKSYLRTRVREDIQVDLETIGDLGCG
jgi:hypothetical protein